MSQYHPHLRFLRVYGLPKGRNGISLDSLEHKYRLEKVIDIGGTLGALNQGVFLVRKLNDNRLCVLKRIPAETGVLEREVLLLQVLKHPNIVGYCDAFITSEIPRQIGLFVEYYEGGTLRDLIGKYHDQGRRIPETFVWHVAHSLANALQYIHHGIQPTDRKDPPVPMDPEVWPPILHRDIKTDNIFLHYAPVQPTNGRALLYPHWPFNVDDSAFSHTTYPKVVLADFGCATSYGEPDFQNDGRLVGSPVWMPPELPKSSARGDVWTVGAVVLSVCRLFPDGPIAHRPVPLGVAHEEWYMSPEAREGIEDIGPGSYYTPEMAELLRRALRPNRTNRPFSYQLMADVRRKEWKVIGHGKVRVEKLVILGGEEHAG